MKRFLSVGALFSCIIASYLIAGQGASRADRLDFLRPANYKYKKQEPYKPNFGARNQPPITLVQFANFMDIIEHDLAEDGTVVIQQPSVWGQARMTTYRKDFDKGMKDELDHFKFVLSARIARSDQASFESQTNLAASLSAGTPETTTGGGKTATPPAPISLSDLAKANVDLLKTAKDLDPIQYSKAFDLLSNVFKSVGMDTGNLGIEPTIFLDEKKNYLDHLNELRRINMGDDIADSAGYGLYLVRMPVSIEPGQKTDEGHGAILNVSVEHDFGPLFLQRTFRNLVINDLVDQLTPILFDVLDQGLANDLDEILEHPNPGKLRLDTQPLTSYAGTNSYELDALTEALNEKTTKVRIPSRLINGKAYPISPTDIVPVFAVPGKDESRPTAMDCALRFLVALRNAQHLPRPRAIDIRLFLERELETAYDIMERGIDNSDIALCKTDLMKQIATDVHNRSFGESGLLLNDFRSLMAVMNNKVAFDLNGALCWAIAVDAALLNERLRDDIQRVEGHAGFHCSVPPFDLHFYVPPPHPNCKEHAGEYLMAAPVFEQYVRTRWPLIAFALDPVVDQQNIADALSIRRDLQLAVAFAFSTGQISFSQMMAFHRQISLDAETIALNRTVTCFAHRNDTFGWRFTPRYQNPPPETNARVLASLLVRTGPNPKYQVNKSKLERGQRELTAVIVMPSFLNAIRMDVRGNYFKLTHPENLTISTARMLEQGRAVKELLEANSNSVCDVDMYRPQDLEGLHVKLQQLEKMLPMQIYRVDVPYENTLGGFDLFVPGTTALVPILVGYDGVDQVTPCSDPTDAKCSPACFLLYGKHFSILETKVVAGGRCIPDTDVEILSREVMRVKIAKDVMPTQIKDGRPFVEVQVATPNGISNRVMIPIAAAKPTLMELGTKTVMVQVCCEKDSKFAVKCFSPTEIRLDWKPTITAQRATLKFTLASNKKVTFTLPAAIANQLVTIDTASFVAKLSDPVFAKVSVSEPNISFKITVLDVDGQAVVDDSASVADSLNLMVTMCTAQPSAPTKSALMELQTKTVTVLVLGRDPKTIKIQDASPRQITLDWKAAIKATKPALLRFRLSTGMQFDLSASVDNQTNTVTISDDVFKAGLQGALQKDGLPIPASLSLSITIVTVNGQAIAEFPFSEAVGDPLKVTVFQCPPEQ